MTLNREPGKITIDEKKMLGEKSQQSRDELKLLLIAYRFPRKIKVVTTARNIAIPINS